MLTAIKDNISGEIHVGTPLEVYVCLKQDFVKNHADSTTLHLLDDLIAAIVAGTDTTSIESSLDVTVMEHPADEDQ